jgi:hypothetical protein
MSALFMLWMSLQCNRVTLGIRFFFKKKKKFSFLNNFSIYLFF